MKSRILALVLAALLGCRGGEPTPGTPPPRPATLDAPAAARGDWRGDLAYLARELPARHVDAFAHVDEVTWRREVAALDAALPTLDDAQIEAGLVRLVARIGDGHTRLALPTREVYPLAFYDFRDGLRVIGAEDPALIGATITAIGDTPIAAARTAIAAYVSHDNEPALRSALAFALIDPVLLRGAGLSPDPGHATYHLTLVDGTVRAFAATPGTRPKVAPPATIPWYLQRTQLAYWNEYDPAARLLYVAYNRCQDSTPPLAEFAASTFAFADQRPVDRFVIDLRHNGGGNSAVLAPVLAALAARPALRVYAIIGRETFSSAVLNAIALRRAGATLVGEPTGGAPSHHGEVKAFTLPARGLQVTYSTKFFANPDVTGDAIAPDLPAPLDYAAWAAGRDPALEAIAAAPR